MKKIILIFLIILINNNYSHSQEWLWKKFNFESGGYVTQIYSPIYPSNNIPSQSNYILYARTDIGGVYRSDNNGATWEYISNYYNESPNGPYQRPSEIRIQGVAVHPTDPKNLIVAWGDEKYDAESSGYKGLWKSDNYGKTNSWSKPNIESPGVWFQGNNNHTYGKLGGDCIIYDPNYYNDLTDNKRLFMGGCPVGNEANLFMSLDNGENWTHSNGVTANYPGTNKDTIISIAMKSGSQHIWVGTSDAIIFTTNNGTNWITLRDGNIPKFIKRIILWGTDANRVAFVTSGIEGNTKIGKIKLINNQWTYIDLTNNFFSSIETDQRNNNSLFTTLMFPILSVDANNKIVYNENHLIAGKYGRPIRESFGTSTNEPGDLWGGYTNLLTNNDNQIIFNYRDPNDVPDFQKYINPTDNERYIYTGMNNLTQNPRYRNIWYSSGGNGCYKSENVNIQSSPPNPPNSNSFAGSTWDFMVNQMSMPVTYDASFQKILIGSQYYQFSYVPISDWTMAWSTDFGLNFSPLNYDRKLTRLNNPYSKETYASNISRILFYPYDPGLSICIGGSIYDLKVGENQFENRRAVFYTRNIDEPGYNFESPYINRVTESHPFLRTDDRNIADGIIFPDGNLNNRIILLVGRSTEDVSPIYNSTGIFITTNAGETFEYSNFNGDNLDLNSNETTEELYSKSIIPAAYNGKIGSLFEPQFNLVGIQESYNSFLYLKEGGMFYTNNGGSQWQATNNPPGVSNFGAGCLKIIGGGKLMLAINGKGLFRGRFYHPPSGVNGTIVWENQSVGGFESCQLIDGPGALKVALAKRSNDTYHKLYITRDGGDNWTALPENPSFPTPLMPYVKSIRINNDLVGYEIWICTAGQGVYVYKNGNNPEQNAEPLIINNTHSINESEYFNRDIIVETGGNLSFAPGINVTMGLNKKIIVRDGGNISLNNIKFNNLYGAPIWEGLIFENVNNNILIENNHFAKAKNPIRIINNSGSLTFNRIIRNNTIDLDHLGNNCIYVKNAYKLLIDKNRINIPGNYEDKLGVMIDNSVSPGLSESSGGNGGGESQFNYNINISNNKFRNGKAGIYIVGQSSTIIPNLIINNHFFDSLSTNSTTAILMFKGYGEIKNNLIQYSNNLQSLGLSLNQSYNYIYNNSISNSNNNILLTTGSYSQLAPEINGENVIWLGGRNSIYSNFSDNISFDNTGSYIRISQGENWLNSNTPNFHLNGTIINNLERCYPVYRNCWNGNGNPNINIRNENNIPVCFRYLTPNWGCLPQQLSIFEIRDLGFGLYDTLFMSQNFSDDTLSSEELTYSQAQLLLLERQYPNAILNFKDFINNFPNSELNIASLYAMYECYQGLDTVTQSLRDTLYGNFRDYLNEKILGGLYSNEFNDIATNLILLCEANMQNYPKALEGYEFITLYHPDPQQRLIASWDYNELLDFLSGQGGGINDIKSQNFNDFLSKKNKKFLYLSEKDSLLKHLKENYIERGTKDFINYSIEINKHSITKNKKFEKENDSETLINDPILSIIKNKAARNLYSIKNLSIREKEIQKIDDLLMFTKIKIESPTNIKVDNSMIANNFELNQNYPNPFNPNTLIKFTIPEDSFVKLSVFDISGREVAVLVNEKKASGKYDYSFNGKNFASGVYFYRLQAGNFIQTKKMLLLK